MARLVVLRFDDNKAAEEFVKAGVDNKVFIADERTNMLRITGEVVGLFGQPTMFCDCTLRKGRVKGYSRGQRWGWWVCSACKKPTRAWGGHLQAVLGAATNHLSIFLEKGKYGEMTPDKPFGESPEAAEAAKRANDAMIVGIEGTSRGVQVHD